MHYRLADFGEDWLTNPEDIAGNSASTVPNFANFSALAGSCMQIIKLK